MLFNNDSCDERRSARTASERAVLQRLTKYLVQKSLQADEKAADAAPSELYERSIRVWLRWLVSAIDRPCNVLRGVDDSE